MKKKIFLTVDTECHDLNQQNIFLWGNTGTEEWGLKKILEMGKECEIPINFFVDIAECKRYGVQFVKKVCDLIASYDQKVYIHLHPNYISGDDSRFHLWEYTQEEQRQIVHETLSYFRELFPNCPYPAFRAGAYSVNKEFYTILKEEYGCEVLDLSYCYAEPHMCHLSHDEINSYNAITTLNDCVVFPNTRYVGFDFFGKQRFFNVDTAETPIGEFKTFLKRNKLENVAMTMHSWNFTKNYFFRGKVWPHKSHLRTFRKMVSEARNHGYEFCDLSSGFDMSIRHGDEQVLNLCETPIDKLKSVYYNFVRFSNLARLYPKWFVLFGIFYLILAIACVVVLLIIISEF